MKQKITYSAIVPLIGGEPLGASAALGGQHPEQVFSYKPFTNNDRHYINYLRENGWQGDYIHLDADDINEESKSGKTVDAVLSVCPCAGLSSFSTSSSADSATNEWLYKTAEHVLGNMKPRIFWGENAPRLSHDSGKKVADKLYEIGKKHGYSLTLYYTESRLHGLAQIRPRTFYFFTATPRAHVFPTWKRTAPDLQEILTREISEDDPMNVLCSEADPKDNAWVAYNMAMTGSKTLLELQSHFTKTTYLIAHADGAYGKNLLDVAAWMEANGFSHIASRARNMQAKLDIGKGYWAHGVTMPVGNVMPALIGPIPFWMINPYRDSYLRIRDCLRLMGMPDDFNLAGEKPARDINHICQSVPVTTAADMMTGVIAFLNGETAEGPSSYIKQNNKTGAVTDRDCYDKPSLDAFL